MVIFTENGYKKGVLKNIKPETIFTKAEMNMTKILDLDSYFFFKLIHWTQNGLKTENEKYRHFET